MKNAGLSVVLLSLSVFENDAFVPHKSTFRRLNTLRSQKDLHEFDFLLQETTDANVQQQVGQPQSRRRIMLNDDRQTVLASTTFAQPDVEEYVEESDPYADIGLEPANPQVMKLQENPSFSTRVENKLKSMDLQDIVSTLIIPSIVVFAGARWGYNRISERVVDKADDLLDAFASEMIYHDGDFEEMKMCQKDYSKKLVWLGPGKTQTMLKKYLELYAKKRTVSPQAISSLSYVFSLFNLSEEKAAQLLVSLCRDMGDGKIASAGKLLFFGTHILKSPQGRAALEPIKDMIKATYREEAVAETMVDASQKAMGEAAYRTAVIAGGKNQKTLTFGWEVLGLNKETAVRIFEDEAAEGFMTDREKMYGGQSTKYDAKGRIIDKKGEIVDEEERQAAENEEEEESASNVYECGECGYTLFVAQGREFKFYGDDFKCPECGAGKDKFKGRDIDEE